MKIKSIATLLVVSLVLASGAVGCKKKLQKTTPLPPQSGQGIQGTSTAGPIGDLPPIDTSDIDDGTLGDPLVEGAGIPLAGGFDDWIEDRATFATETVYFDFDKSNVKMSEISKVESVATLFKTMQGKALRIEGHCDERGTAEYNRALGERRALSIRELLITLGIPAEIIDTRTYAEGRPLDPAQTEEAYAQNRRGEFIVLSPPGAAN